MKRILLAALSCAALGACQHAARAIEASGTMEATSVQVSSRSAGVVKEIAADEGSSVREGELLARIDHVGLDIQLAQAKSGVSLARAQLDLLTSGARGEDLAQAQEQLNQASETLRGAQDDFTRMKSLSDAGAATRKQREDAELRFTTARAQAAAAEQALKKLQNFARPEEVKAALARLDQAAWSVRLLQKSIDDCEVKAPVDGVVTERLMERGELAAPGMGMFVITDLRVMRLTIYVPEPALGRIRLGEVAGIAVDSHPGKVFPGRVTFISPIAEFTPRDVQTKDERVKLVYAVRIQVENPAGIFKPGMPADAVLTGGPGGGPGSGGS
jgi:HlyD family secretion protein